MQELDVFYERLHRDHSPVNDLSRFRAFLAKQGHPEHQLTCLHVAGTNGKGSTVNYLYHILMEAGYQVGTWTTPYLHHPCDRIRVQHHFIEDQALLDIVQRYESEWEKDQLSYHEIDVFIAMMYFIEQKVDVAIFEVGLGGEKDATNVITPLLSVITNIGKDHMAYLGRTYQSIAQAKAGIIKPHVPLFTSETKKVCLDVFKQQCDLQHTSMTCVKPYPYQKTKEGIYLKYQDRNYFLKTQALYQVKNASLVLESVLYLKNVKHFSIQEDAIARGFQKAIWPGRFEIIHQDPLILIDGAHNLEGIDAFIESARSYIPCQFVFSVLMDKDISLMLEHLLCLKQTVILTAFEDERLADIQALSVRYDLQYEEDYRTVIDRALEMHQRTLVTGSLHFISKVREYVLTMKGESTL